MTNFKINGHPKPYPYESARGYLLRIVDINGYKSIPSMTFKFGAKFMPIVSVASDYWRAVASRIELPLNMDEGELTRYFETHWSTKIYQSENQYLKGLFHQDCRLCPLCIQESEVCLADWDFALVVMCKKHQCILIDDCPHCSEPISWIRGEVNTCPNCMGKYSNFKPAKLTIDDPLMTIHNAVSSHYEHSIEKIAVSCCRVLRLADNTLATPYFDIMRLSSLTVVMRQAACLISSKKYREGYLDWLRLMRPQYSEISEAAVCEPYEAFCEVFPVRYFTNNLDREFILPLDNVDAILVSDIDKPIKQAKLLGIKISRISNSRGDLTSINLTSQIESHRLCTLLNIPPELLTKLTLEGVLKPTNKVDRFQHCFFDLNDIIELLKPKQLPKESFSQYIPLSELFNAHNTNFFALAPHDVIELILKQEITLFESGDGLGYMHSFIHSPTVLNQLHQVMISKAENLQVTMLAQILFTTEANVIRLYENGYLTVNNFWQQGCPAELTVSNESYKNILSNYLSLSRLCYFLKLNITDAHATLKKKKIKPIFTIKKGSRKLYLYSLAENNLEVIREALCLHFKTNMIYDGYGLIKYRL